MPKEKTILILIAFFVLVVYSHSHAQSERSFEKEDVMIYTERGHFLLATTAHYTISSLCERAIKKKYPCRIGAALFVASVAYWEMNKFESFDGKDFRADLLGVGFSMVLLEW